MQNIKNINKCANFHFLSNGRYPSTTFIGAIIHTSPMIGRINDNISCLTNQQVVLLVVRTCISHSSSLESHSSITFLFLLLLSSTFSGSYIHYHDCIYFTESIRILLTQMFHLLYQQDVNFCGSNCIAARMVVSKNRGNIIQHFFHQVCSS